MDLMGLINTAVGVLLAGGAGLLFFRENKNEKRIQNESSAIDVVNKAMDRLEKENAALTEKYEKTRDELDDLRTEYALKRCDKKSCITRIPPNNY